MLPVCRGLCLELQSSAGCHSRWGFRVQLRISVGIRQEQHVETVGNSRKQPMFETASETVTSIITYYNI